MSRLLRLLALAAVIVCVELPATRAASYEDATLPLPETYFPALKGILSSAVSQSPRMIARNAENAAAEGNRIVMRAGQLPSLSGYLNYYPYDTQLRANVPGSTVTNQLSYNLTLSQPVYHWGALRNNTRMGELQLHMAQGQTAEGYRILVQEIRAQYLQLVIKKATVAKATLSRHAAEDNYTVSQTKLEKKVISDADMFMPTVTRDQAVLALDRAREDYASSKQVFAKLCGAPLLSDDQIPDEFPDVASSPAALEPFLTDFTSQKEPSSYNLTYISDQIAVEKLTYKNITTRLRPQLNLVVGTSQSQISYTTDISSRYEVTDYFVGLGVTWSIFDGFSTKGAAASSMARRRQLEQSYRDLSTDLTDQARSQMKQVSFARRAMDITDRLLTSSTGALRDKKADATRGLASENDVNTYQLNYHEARINAYVARSDYLMKNGDFLSILQQDPALNNLPHP